MKNIVTLCALLMVAGSTLAAQVASIHSLMSRDLVGGPGREVRLITVQYAPGGVDPVHTHDAQAFVYVLEGTVAMQVKGGQPVTLRPGDTFYEGPDDVHIVGRNVSDSVPAKVLVFLVTKTGAPLLRPVP